MYHKTFQLMILVNNNKRRNTIWIVVFSFPLEGFWDIILNKSEIIRNVKKEINFLLSFKNFNKKGIGIIHVEKYFFINEPQHDKPNKWSVQPAETQIRLCPVRSVITVRSKDSSEPKVSSWLTWVNSYKSLIQHFSLSVAMATSQNE